MLELIRRVGAVNILRIDLLPVGQNVVIKTKESIQKRGIPKKDTTQKDATQNEDKEAKGDKPKGRDKDVSR